MVRTHGVAAFVVLLLVAGAGGGASQAAPVDFPVRTFGFGHVSALAFSADGSLLVVAGATATIHLVDVSAWQVVRTLEGHHPQGVVEDVAFSPDGGTLASACSDGTVKLWDVATGEELLTLRGHPSGVTSISFSPDGRFLASASRRGAFRLWDLTDGAALHPLEGAGCWAQEGWFRAVVAWSPEGNLIAWAYSRFIALLDPRTGEEVGCLVGHDAWVLSLSWSPDGRYLAAAGEDRKVTVWDVENRTEVRSYALPGDVMAWSPDWTTLAVKRDDTEIALVDVDTGREQAILVGHEGTVTALAWGPDGNILVSGSDDMTVRAWDRAAGQELRRLGGHTCRVYSVAWSPDGRTLVSGDELGTVKFWNPLAGAEERSLAAGEGYVLPLAWSPDGGLLAMGRPDAGTMALLDVATGEIVRVLEGYCVSGWVFGAAWSAAGEALAYAGECPVRLWDRRRDETRNLPCYGPVTWSPDGTKLACASGDRSVVILDVSTGEELARIADVGGHVSSLAWSPDGTGLVIGWGYAAITFFDLEAGQPIWTVWPGSYEVYAMAFSPDGRILATLSAQDMSLRLWDPGTGELLSMPALWTPLIAWSPDGEHLAAASFDGVVKILKVSALLKR